MITFADKESTPMVRAMWKECFGDTSEYMHLYFSEKYKEENTLIYWENGVAAASLQMLAYDIRFYNQIMPSYYLAGLCTLSDFRNKGYMGKLIHKAFEVMRERKIPISTLVPAEEWLYGYYNKFSFEETFRKGEYPIDLTSILIDSKNSLKEAYEIFDAKYQQYDFCVLKNIKDFQTIVKEYIAEEYPIKYNLRGMSAIVDPLVALRAYAKAKPLIKFSIRVTGLLTSQSNIFRISEGKVEEVNNKDVSDITFDVSISMLSRLLFGFKISELTSEYQLIFDEHTPIMNLMLE